ncbi:MAG: alpha/beta hydrolase [Candidatus Nanopelagicales bacterium]
MSRRFLPTLWAAATLTIFALPGVVTAQASAQSVAAPASTVRLHVQALGAAGTTFAYAELGQGRPLLLLNGTGSPMNEWDPALLASLAGSHRVVVFDYPGIGLSGPSPGRWLFNSAADWTAAFLERLLPGQSVDVLGWSMGGFIAQRMAVQHPRLVHRLILAGTNPGGDGAVLGPAWVQAADSQVDETDKTYLSTNYPHTSVAQAAGRSFLQRLQRAVDSGAYPAETVPSPTYRAMVAAEDPWLRSNANAQELARIQTRTLVITGVRDVITPAANSRRLASLIPGATLRLIADAGHSFLFQNPGRAARIFTAFLDPPFNGS